jgi:hypothetical protein
MSQRVSLSSRGFAHISSSLRRPDFTFVVGHRRYRCHSLLAEFISPVVCRLRDVDCTVNRFRIDIDDDKRDFAHFMSLLEGESLCVTGENRLFFALVSHALGNTELLSQIVGDIFGTLTTENARERLRIKSGWSEDCEEEVSFLAARLMDIPREGLNSMDIEELYLLLGHRSLKIESEDWLYCFISSKFSVDPTFFSLLEFVRFEFLSTEILCDFADASLQYCDQINQSIMANVLQRLKLPNRMNESNEIERYHRRSILRFKYDDRLGMQGIQRFLKAQTGSVRITLSSQETGMNTGTLLVTENLPNQWICYEFDNVRVKLNHYCVVSHMNRPHLKSWVVEVSETGRHWIEVDREVDHVIEGRNGIRSFALKSEEKCRFIRIRQIGRSNVSDDRLLVNEFDIFGELIGPDHCTFAATGAKGVEQHAWHCKTCEIVGGYTCCDACAAMCHKGHELVDEGYLMCYCDCGTDRYCRCRLMH